VRPKVKQLKGSYILLIELGEDELISVGRLGTIAFPRGSYAYVGSAMGGLEQRISRHLRKNKSLHWHVDYLLEKAIVKEVIICQSEERLECTIAQALARKLSFIPGFGSSDCKCASHLYFAPGNNEIKTSIREVLGELGLTTRGVPSPQIIGTLNDEP
jgi:Uri superfamily endonuclease